MNSILEIIKSLDGRKTIDLIIAVTIIAVVDIFSPIFSYIILKMFNIKKSKKDIKENTFYTPIISFFRITSIYIALMYLKKTFDLSENIINISTKIYKVVVTITIANSLANSITRKSRFIKIIKEKSDKEINDGATKILVRIIKILIYAIAVFVIFAEIGYDLSGLVTGLGLGSIVLTLATQDTIKNLLGGIIIYIDKPFMVGDDIKFANYKGNVEDMTLRSTKIRTPDNTVIQIPNALIASQAVENLSKIKKRRYNLELKLSLENKLEKIDVLKEKIYEVLVNNENVITDSINLYFTEICQNGYKIMITCYFNITEYLTFLQLKEQVNRYIIDIIKNENIVLQNDIKTIELK